MSDKKDEKKPTPEFNKLKEEVEKPAPSKPPKPVVKKLVGAALEAVKSTAPDGFRELKPGKSVNFGARCFSSGKFYEETTGTAKKIITEKQKNRFVPETVIKQFKLKDSMFL